MCIRDRPDDSLVIIPLLQQLALLALVQLNLQTPPIILLLFHQNVVSSVYGQ